MLSGDICQRCWGYGRIPLNSRLSGPVMNNYNSFTCQTCHGTGQANGQRDSVSDSEESYESNTANVEGGGISAVILLMVFGGFFWCLNYLSNLFAYCSATFCPSNGRWF